MAEHLIARMRAMLEEHARVPFGLDECPAFFAENPAESDEILHQLFAEYDDGSPVEPDIRALIKLMRVARKYVSLKRTAALTQQGILRAAYTYPPTCELLMYMALRGLVHAKERGERCETLAREYPDVAQTLLAQLVREQGHDKFYEVAPTGWMDSAKEIDTLRSMIARAEARRLLDEMGGEA